jgi:hypothetical protein
MSPGFLFAGPTLARARLIDPGLSLAGLDLLPPIKRGQLPVLMAQHQPGTVIIVDGLFHTEVAVGHQEIRAMLARGWKVWGLSSMGAIRAREMSGLGMVGFGKVYQLFCQEGVDFRDDEVTLLHDKAPDYTELSEPLVHLRAALDDLVARELLGAEARAGLIGELEGMWYADRTLSWLAARLRGLGVEPRGILDDFDRYRVKSLDLIEFLRLFGAGLDAGHAEPRP